MKTGRMKQFLLSVCCICAGIFVWASSVDAAKISSANQAKQKALQKVPNATVTDLDKDYDDGTLVYEVELVKGAKKFDITYRASDGKMIEYGWEKISVGASQSKPLISKNKCKSLALKKVKKAKIVSISQKFDDGVDIYKVKATAGNKRFKLKFHARTGALIEYQWELAPSTQSSSANGYISLSKAKQVALADVPGATVVKAEFDKDDGIAVYEVELVKGAYEYEYKIDAKTGKILEKDRDWND